MLMHTTLTKLSHSPLLMAIFQVGLG